MPICALIRNFWGRIRNFVMRSEIRNNYEFSVIVGSSVEPFWNMWLKLIPSGSVHYISLKY